MQKNAHDAYLESEILAADPVELVRILYRTALDSAREASRRLAEGDICARSKAISRAIGAIGELNSSLRHDVGGEMSRRLAGLYGYMQGRLLQANLDQAAEPLDETAGLLATLLEAWQAVRPASGAAQQEGYPIEFAQIPLEEADTGRIRACA